MITDELKGLNLLFQNTSKEFPKEKDPNPVCPFCKNLLPKRSQKYEGGGVDVYYVGMQGYFCRMCCTVC